MISRFVPQNLSTVRRAVLVGAVGLAGALVLTACGGSASGAAKSATPSPTGDPSSSNSSRDRGGSFPGAPAASGTVAQISGTTMQVQNPQSGQVAVTWTASTKFTHTVTASISAVKVGDCLVAVAASGTSSSATSFTAATMVLSAPVNGSCTGGARTPGSAQDRRPSGFPTGGHRPSGFPTGARPSGFPSGASGRPETGAFASGKVTSVSGSTVIIAARGFGSADAKTTSKTVTADSATKLTTEAATTSASLAVGKCVSAQGKADSSGAVTATSVRITDPTKGQCATGFGGFGRFGGRNGG